MDINQMPNPRVEAIEESTDYQNTLNTVPDEDNEYERQIRDMERNLRDQIRTGN